MYEVKAKWLNTTDGISNEVKVIISSYKFIAKADKIKYQIALKKTVLKNQ